MSAESILAAIRKHAKDRRDIIDGALHKDRNFESFVKLRGQDDELMLLEGAISQAIQKARDAEAPGEEPIDDI